MRPPFRCPRSRILPSPRVAAGKAQSLGVAAGPGTRGLSGGSVAVQNVFPQWLFCYVFEVLDIAEAERWRRLAWLAASYLVLTSIVRMAFWHLGYRLFTRARENVIFGLRGKFFHHVNQLCLRFHGTPSSGELFSYLFGSPLRAFMQFCQHATMSLPGAIVSVLAPWPCFGNGTA